MFQKTRSTHHRAISSIAAEALEPRIAPAILIGLTNKDVLISFDSDAPTKILSAAKISGLAAGENIVSIDARPANGLIYGLTNLNTLYTLNPYSGAATQVGAGPAEFSLGSKTAGIDFNPTVDRLRVVTNADLNFRVIPNTGAIVDGDAVTPGTQPDTELAYDAADENKGKNPSITAVAYDRNFQGASQTTLFGIDSTRNTLVRIGGVNGTPSPNDGAVFTVGELGVNPARVSTSISLPMAPRTPRCRSEQQPCYSPSTSPPARRRPWRRSATASSSSTRLPPRRATRSFSASPLAICWFLSARTIQGRFLLACSSRTSL